MYNTKPQLFDWNMPTTLSICGDQNWVYPGMWQFCASDYLIVYSLKELESSLMIPLGRGSTTRNTAEHLWSQRTRIYPDNVRWWSEWTSWATWWGRRWWRKYNWSACESWITIPYKWHVSTHIICFELIAKYIIVLIQTIVIYLYNYLCHKVACF